MTMYKIIALLLAVTAMTANETSTHIPKRIVTGGNKNATIGQVVAAYKNGFHVGIRTPDRVALSIQESQTPTFSALVYPNPSQGLVFFSAENIKSVVVTDLYGRTIVDAVNMNSNTIQLPHRGVFFVKITDVNNLIFSTNVIFN